MPLPHRLTLCEQLFSCSDLIYAEALGSHWCLESAGARLGKESRCCSLFAPMLLHAGLFAVLSAFTRMFPTPPPSRRKVLPAAEYKEQRRQHKWGLPLHWPGGPHHHANSHQATSPHSSHAGNTGNTHSVSNGNATAPQAVAMTTSTIGQQGAAASFLQADASPGWGRDQGLSRVSAVQQDSDGNQDSATLPQAGRAAGSSPGVLVLPSQRGLPGAAAAPAGPVAQQVAAAAASSGGGRQAGSAVVHRQQERGFVTIDL